MPVSVTDLKPGDRVVLNCPKARGQAKREAVFQGIFRSVAEAMASEPSIDAMIMMPQTEAFLSQGTAWARFLLQTISGPMQILEYPGGGAIKGMPSHDGPTALMAAFLIEPDGGLREEEGRRIFIERRVVMGQG